MRFIKIKTVTIFILLLFLSFIPILSEQERIPGKEDRRIHPRAKGKRRIPPPTERGKFSGTWFYVDRDKRFVFFIKEIEGKNKIKIKWVKDSGEMFETDWNGKCQYKFAGYDAHVTMEISNPEDKNLLKGKWSWQYLTDSMERAEQASFHIYRAEDGRKLVWILPDFEQTIKRGEKSKVYSYKDMHILRKVSDRIVNWGDIPF